jgi:hypothetical protein
MPVARTSAPQCGRRPDIRSTPPNGWILPRRSHDPFKASSLISIKIAALAIVHIVFNQMEVCMSRCGTRAAACGLGGALLLAAITPGLGAPAMPATAVLKSQVVSDVIDVRWRYGGWRYGGWRYGGWVAGGFATGLAIGAIAASRPYYYAPYHYGGPGYYGYYGRPIYYGPPPAVVYESYSYGPRYYGPAYAPGYYGPVYRGAREQQLTSPDY